LGGKWRKQMGIEPTGPWLSPDPTGFEDRTGHQCRSCFHRCLHSVTSLFCQERLTGAPGVILFRRRGRIACCPRSVAEKRCYARCTRLLDGVRAVVGAGEDPACLGLEVGRIVPGLLSGRRGAESAKRAWRFLRAFHAPVHKRGTVDSQPSACYMMGACRSVVRLGRTFRSEGATWFWNRKGTVGALRASS